MPQAAVLCLLQHLLLNSLQGFFSLKSAVLSELAASQKCSGALKLSKRTYERALAVCQQGMPSADGCDSETPATLM